MVPPIENLATCKIRSVIRFLIVSDKNVKVAQVNRQINEVYEQHIMTGEMVRRWGRAFKDGRMNVHDEKRSGRASVNEDLVQCRKLTNE